MASLRALLAELGSYTDRLHIRYCIVAGVVAGDLAETKRRFIANRYNYVPTSKHWHRGFADLARMANNPDDITEHFSTTAEGLKPCKQDCLFCLYGDTLTADA
jgi:hypothetical protein